MDANNDWRQRRQFANLPNGAACLGNLDCASGCCLVQYEFAGVCVVRALPGQVRWLNILKFPPRACLYWVNLSITTCLDKSIWGSHFGVKIPLQAHRHGTVLVHGTVHGTVRIW